MNDAVIHGPPSAPGPSPPEPLCHATGRGVRLTRDLRQARAGGLGTVCAHECAQLARHRIAVALTAAARWRAYKTEGLRVRVVPAQAFEVSYNVEGGAAAPVRARRTEDGRRPLAIDREVPCLHAWALREPARMPCDHFTSVAFVATPPPHGEGVAKGAIAGNVYVDH